MLGVLIHVLGDAINNIGVIISAVVIWQASGHGRYYIDPAISCFIAIMILISAIPLTKSSGSILLQIAPGGVETDHVKHDMEQASSISLMYQWVILTLCRFPVLNLSTSCISGVSISGRQLPLLILFLPTKQPKTSQTRRRLSWSVFTLMASILLLCSPRQ